MVRMRRTLPIIAWALLAAACGGTASPASGTAQTPTFALQVATTDLYVGRPQRVQVGIFGGTDQGTLLLTGGNVPVSLTLDGGGSPIQGTARYVPAPGTPAAAQPGLTPPSEARGVYQLSDVTFPTAGTWTASVAFQVNAQPVTVADAFTVAEDPALPAPGEPALETENLTMADDRDPQAIDSRAQDGEPVPDPELHRDTIAEAVADGRAALVLFATPVYCTSQFCGPTTDALQELAANGPRDAAYIHVEIWHDYQASEVNEAAADWLLRDGDLTEPWLYLIGPDGTIEDRWSPLFDEDEVRAELERVAG
jgi:hypothetical protein